MSSQEQDLKTGTTTVGIIAKDAVVLAADMKATMGHLNYDLESKKVYRINNYAGLTNAGSVGDSLVLIRFIKAQAELYETERETPMTAKAMTTFMSNILNGNRYFPYSVQFVVGGVLPKPSLFELTPYGGVLERNKFAASGSGTVLAMATLDQNYKSNMTEDEAVRLAIKAVSAAKHRDIYSGGVSISVMVIDSKGVRDIDDSKVRKIVDTEIKN